MFGSGLQLGNRRGSALIIVMVLVVTVSALLAAMMWIHVCRDKAEAAGEDRIGRMYAAEAGLERAQLELSNDSIWLTNNVHDTDIKAVFAGGGDSFTVGGYTVSVIVRRIPVTTSPLTYDANWYLIKSTAVGPAPKTTVTTIAETAKNGTVFSDYARFVSLNDLSVGDNANYNGKVYANGKLAINGDHISFYEKATCHGTITYGSTSNKNTCKFYKGAIAGVPTIALPEAAALQGIAQTAMAGAQIYDYQDAAFKVKFQAATGSLPGSDTVETITLNKTTMTVVTTSGGKTMTESNVPIPHEGALWSRGNVTVQGNISRRFTVSTPAKIYINGSVRYVDDSGGAQWQLRKKSDNSLAAFDAPHNTWSPTSDWDNNYNYVEATDWSTRSPVVGGEHINPTLGLVSDDTIYLNGTQNNREIHAALYTSGDVVKPNFSGTKPNLLTNGCIITTGTNPLSSAFTCRIYAYDPNLRGNPPPGFPGGDCAQFHNWHILELER